MSEKLKPCPFCGEAEHLYPSYRNMGAGKPYAIDCLGCGMDFVPRDGMDVIAMWNRRTPAEPQVEADPSAVFSAWISKGPKLAKAAGVYVGITVSDGPLSQSGRTK